MNKVYLMAGLAIAIVAGTAVYLAEFAGSDPSEKAKEALAPDTSKSPKVSVAPPPKSEAASPENAAPTQPSFDVVRIAPDGTAVLAGRARPGDKVTILNGDQVVGTVTANARGEWALVPKKALKPGDTQLKIISENTAGEKATSDHSVVLKVPERDSDEGALAVLVPGKGAPGAKVLQSPKPGPGIKKGTLTLDVIDYDDEGYMHFAGKGASGATLKIYADNRPMAEATIDQEGAWGVRPKSVLPPGTYTLRLDQWQEGSVTARIEVPFTRSPPIETLDGDKFVVVQPGNSLWRIARRELGGGIRYTVIYDANKHQIRDPDLIFPGQILAVPEKP
ncbi:MAG: peptidoglycan-binding protein [Rhodospirillaceae bacterium]|nr:peptidoglycan-binding protein [Rhodospirillaceae bacterium]